VYGLTGTVAGVDPVVSGRSQGPVR